MADTYSPTSGMKAAARRAITERKKTKKAWIGSPFSFRKG